MRNAFSIWVAVLVTIVASGLASPFAAQDGPKPKEPEYVDVFFALNPDDGSLIPLERKTPEIRTKTKMLGFAGGSGVAEVPGERSAVRFASDTLPAFVVRVASRDRDPASLIRMYVWEAGKGNRTMSLSQVRAMGIGATSTMTKSEIAFVATKYGDASFKVVPSAPVPPGEYALVTASTRELSMFGVDGSKSQ